MTTLIFLCGAGVGALMACMLLMWIMTRATRAGKASSDEMIRLMKQRNATDAERLVIERSLHSDSLQRRRMQAPYWIRTLPKRTGPHWFREKGCEKWELFDVRKFEDTLSVYGERFSGATVGEHLSQSHPGEWVAINEPYHSAQS